MTNSTTPSAPPEGYVTRTAGGALRWTPEAPAPVEVSNTTTTQQLDQLRVRAHSQTHRVVGAGEVQSQGRLSYSLADDNNGHSDAVLRTLKDSYGLPVLPKDAKPDAKVTLHGIQTTVEAALSAGLLARAEDGALIVPTSQPPVEASKEDITRGIEEEFKHDEALPSAHAEQALNDMAASVDAGSQVAAVMELTAAGTLSSTTTNRIASQLGILPSEVSGRLAPVLSAFSDQAAQLARSMGVPAGQENAVWDWAKSNPATSRALTEAMKQHAFSRSTVSYEPIIHEFVATMPAHSMEALRGGNWSALGVSVREQDGRVLVKLPSGAEVTWEVAIRGGHLPLGQMKRAPRR